MFKQYYVQLQELILFYCLIVPWNWLYTIAIHHSMKKMFSVSSFQFCMKNWIQVYTLYIKRSYFCFLWDCWVTTDHWEECLERFWKVERLFGTLSFGSNSYLKSILHSSSYVFVYIFLGRNISSDNAMTRKVNDFSMKKHKN